VLEGHSRRIDIEHHIRNKVGPLVTPISDDWLCTELESCNLFVSVLITTTLVSDLHYPLQTTFSGHELKDGVHHKRAS
jgi:hypothetical protein